MNPAAELVVAGQQRLINIVLPQGGYVVALAEAYFDDSGTHEESGFLCLAGYIFTAENAAALAPRWQQMLDKYKLPYFHMSECAHAIGIYSHLSRPECDDAAREAIALTKQFASRGIALSIEKAAFQYATIGGIWSSPYAFLCGQVFFGVKNWANETGFDGRVSYFYESGTKGWGAASSDIDRIFSAEPDIKEEVRHLSHTVIGKADSAALQCADLLAWHWYTYNKRAARRVVAKRGDFKELIGLQIDPHHYDVESMEAWLAAWAATVRHLSSLPIPLGGTWKNRLYSPLELLAEFIRI